MQFLVLAYDSKDEGAAQRRLEVREAHLATIAKYKASGNMRIGAAILDDDGAMVGSCIIADFPSRAELDAWLMDEPYLTQNVWDEVYVQGCKLAPAFA